MSIPNPTRPKHVDLERRRHLCRLAKEATVFPNDKVPDPFTLTITSKVLNRHVDHITIANAEDPTVRNNQNNGSSVMNPISAPDPFRDLAFLLTPYRFHGATRTIESIVHPFSPHAAKCC